MKGKPQSLWQNEKKIYVVASLQIGLIQLPTEQVSYLAFFIYVNTIYSLFCYAKEKNTQKG